MALKASAKIDGAYELGKGGLIRAEVGLSFSLLGFTFGGTTFVLHLVTKKPDVHA